MPAHYIKQLARGLLILTSFVLLAGCGNDDGGSGSGLSGTITIDGSSTVFPITQGVAEEFQREHSNVRISVGYSGTGGGLAKFCAGETDISNASRAITEAERAKCEANGIEFTEFKIALDGLSVAVNPENDWVQCLTTEQLETMWMPNSPIETWSDMNPSWPDEEITFYSPGTDSGTFEYFTETIMGEAGRIRTDIATSEDDNVLVQGVIGEENAIGYFGYAYYVVNQERLNVVAINNGDGCVKPTDETIQSGEYAPLSRPLYIYVNNQSLREEPAVAEFVRFFFTDAVEIIPLIGYVPLPESDYQEQLEQLNEITGATSQSGRQSGARDQAPNTPLTIR